MLLRSKKNKQRETSIVGLVVLCRRYGAALFLFPAAIGLYACHRWSSSSSSSLLLINDESMSWTRQPPTTPLAVATNDNDNDNDDDDDDQNDDDGNGGDDGAASQGHPTSAVVHLVRPSTNSSSSLSWRALASAWDRDTTFEDLLEISSPSSSSSSIIGDYTTTPTPPQLLLPPVPPGHRVAVIIHCSPKMGSLTLRRACYDNLINRCDMAQYGRTDPNGYNNATELGEIVRRCDTTHHFCQRRGLFEKRTGKFDDVAFVHLYPFRMYDSWTVSALKQEYDRGGDRGCDNLRKMMDTCSDRHGELAFFKYPKTQMSEIRPLLMHRVEGLGEVHRVLLYPFSEIHAVISALSDAYGIPLLPGSDGTAHVSRPRNGTCDDAILDKFHECFTSKLMELP